MASSIALFVKIWWLIRQPETLLLQCLRAPRANLHRTCMHVKTLIDMWRQGHPDRGSPWCCQQPSMMVAARLRPSGECAGVVERVVMSRAGEFSCPVQCGVLLMADCNISQWAKRPNQENPEILQAFQVSVSELHTSQHVFSSKLESNVSHHSAL